MFESSLFRMQFIKIKQIYSINFNRRSFHVIRKLYSDSNNGVNTPDLNQNTDNNLGVGNIDQLGPLTRQEFIDKEQEEVMNGNNRQMSEGQLLDEKSDRVNRHADDVNDKNNYFATQICESDALESTKRLVFENAEKYRDLSDKLAKELSSNKPTSENSEEFQNSEEVKKDNHVLKAMRDLDYHKGKTLVNAAMSDPNIDQTTKSNVDHFGKELDDYKKFSDDAWSSRSKYIKDEYLLRTREENLNKHIQEEQEKERNRSLIDDFADPSTEMPSYMDGDD